MDCNICPARIECMLEPKSIKLLDLWPSDLGVTFIHSVMDNTPIEERSQLWWLMEYLFSIGFQFACNQSYDAIARQIFDEKLHEGPSFMELENVTSNMIQMALGQDLLQLTIKRR